MNDKHEMQHVALHDGDNKDDSGVGAIIKSFIKNPTGAFTIVAFIGGMYGLYYTNQAQISEVRAAQLSNAERIGSKLDLVLAAEADSKTRIDGLYTRSDTRYAQIIGKLSAHDVDIAKIVTNIDFIADQFRNGAGQRFDPPRIKPTPTPSIP